MAPKNNKTSGVGAVGTDLPSGTRPPSDIGKTGAAGSGGPSVEMVRSVRAMKPYTIFETEIIGITRASALSSIAFSFAAGLASFAFKVYFETEGPKSFDKMEFSGSLTLAAICGAVGVWANNWRHEIITQIRKESGDNALKAVWSFMHWFRPEGGEVADAESKVSKL